jgi:hypothetical protein
MCLYGISISPLLDSLSCSFFNRQYPSPTKNLNRWQDILILVEDLNYIKLKLSLFQVPNASEYTSSLRKNRFGF